MTTKEIVILTKSYLKLTHTQRDPRTFPPQVTARQVWSAARCTQADARVALARGMQIAARAARSLASACNALTWCVKGVT